MIKQNPTTPKTFKQELIMEALVIQDWYFVYSAYSNLFVSWKKVLHQDGSFQGQASLISCKHGIIFAQLIHTDDPLTVYLHNTNNVIVTAAIAY